MSRSFYVDSLIVKDSPHSSIGKDKPGCDIISSPSPQHGSQAISIPKTRIPTPTQVHAIHPLPCYPRHHGDIMNMYCQLCMTSPSTLLPESTGNHTSHISIVPTTLPLSLSSALPSTNYSVSRLHTSVMSQRDVSLCPTDRLSPSEKVSSITEKQRIRYGSIGMFQCLASKTFFSFHR